MSEVNSVSSINSLTDWITAISTTVIAVGILITLWSIVIDHKRSRRQKAVDMMLTWNSSRGLICDYIIRALNGDQLKKLFNKQPFELEMFLKPALELFFLQIGLMHPPIPEGFLEIKNDRVYLNAFQVNLFSIYAAKSVNYMEIVACAWKNDIADKEIIETEFRRVFIDKNNMFILQNYINESGVYPSIRKIAERYLDHIRKVDIGKEKKWYQIWK